MSKTEWKLGDVAMVRLDADTEVRVTWNYDGWRSAKGSFYDPKGSFYDPALPARPLVVIDAEDREQVERLTDLYERAIPDGLVTPTASTDALQAALREFANPTPPKPDEPTGLGAVVEDADGRRWVRWHCDGDPMHVSKNRPWSGANGVGSDRAYDDINAVRVLSEGVTA